MVARASVWSSKCVLSSRHLSIESFLDRRGRRLYSRGSCCEGKSLARECRPGVSLGRGLDELRAFPRRRPFPAITPHLTNHVQERSICVALRKSR